MGPSSDPNSVVERDLALGLRVLSGVLRPFTSRVGTADTARLDLDGLGEAAVDDEADDFVGVLTRLAGGRRGSGSCSIHGFLSIAIDDCEARSGACSGTRLRFFNTGAEEGAPMGTGCRGVNDGGTRYLGLGARIVRVVTTAGVCVMGLLDFEEENQEKFCDASIAERKEDALGGKRQAESLWGVYWRVRSYCCLPTQGELKRQSQGRTAGSARHCFKAQPNFTLRTSASALSHI